MVDRRVDCGHALSNRGPARFRKEVGCLQHRLLTTGHREVVDADLSDYFGQIPHSNLLRSIARRVSDGRLLGWVKAWLEMAVEAADGNCRYPHRLSTIS